MARRRERDLARVRHFVEQLALVLGDMGLPPMPARVWAAAMSADEDTVTPGDLADRLGVSPAAISGAVRYLVQVGLLQRVPAPGSRRQHYAASPELWYEAFGNRQAVIGAFSRIAAEGVDALGPRTSAGRRIAEIRDFFDFMGAELPGLLERWRAHRNGRPDNRKQ
jgi:hypothetical protein